VQPQCPLDHACEDGRNGKGKKRQNKGMAGLSVTFPLCWNSKEAAYSHRAGTVGCRLQCPCDHLQQEKGFRFLRNFPSDDTKEVRVETHLLQVLAGS